MNKIYFLPMAILLFSLLAACQPHPTPVDSTRHAPAANNSTNFNSMNHGATDHNSMNHSAMNHETMNHSAMQSAPNAGAQPFDLQFLDTMIAHHQGAVDMAKMVGGKTENAELEKFAEQITADQTKEIAQMKQWRDEWFAGKPSAMNMEMPGMKESMQMDMGKLANATGRDFDAAFVEMMVPHHAGAVVMSRDALNKAEHQEIKTLAGQIIQGQEAEIKLMQNWKTKWSK